MTSEIRQSVFSLDEGYALLQFPSPMSPESASLVLEWLAIVSRQIERMKQAAPETNSQPAPICGAYAASWESLGKPTGWKGCPLPANHEGDHHD